jgi:hypothetical protein
MLDIGSHINATLQLLLEAEAERRLLAVAEAIDTY